MESPALLCLLTVCGYKYSMSLPHCTMGLPGGVALSVTCLTADLGAASSILARAHTFGVIDHEIITTDILLPSADSRKVVVS